MIATGIELNGQQKMRGKSNRQKNVAGMLRRRQKQNYPTPQLPSTPPRQADKSSIPKSKKP
jgi:hypothetical protein